MPQTSVGHFAAEDAGSFSYPSEPLRKPVLQNQRLQTEKVQLRNMRVQAQNVGTAEVQTAEFEYGEDKVEMVEVQPPGERMNANAKKDAATTSSTTTTWLINKKAPVSDAELAGFLKRVSKLTLLELDAGVEEEVEAAFSKYEPRWEDEGEEAVRCVRRLDRGFLETAETSGGLDDATRSQGTRRTSTKAAVLDLAWNATGNILAASYGQLDTLGWCEYSSFVHVWNVFGRRSGTQDDKQGGQQIEVQGDVVSLAFHPKLPNILAGGSYNGELILWDVTAASGTDPQIAISSIDDYFHREAIHEIQWVEEKRRWILCTVSGDGRILLWDIADKLEFPYRGFTVLQRKKQIGGRALAFSPFDSQLFVLGSETGALIRGMCPAVLAGSTQISGARASNWRASALRILDPLPQSSKMAVQHHVEGFIDRAASSEKEEKQITAGTIFRSKVPDPAHLFPQPKTTDLEPHSGPIVACKFSPFHRKMLLTAGLDGAVKLFDILQQRPLYVFYPPLKGIIHAHGNNDPISGEGALTRNGNRSEHQHIISEKASAGLADLAWSHARPLVFAVAPEYGSVVQVYDLLQSKHEPAVSVHFGMGESGGLTERVTRVRFNPTQRGLLAVGGSSGGVKIFSLPWSLAAPCKSTETAHMNRLMSRG